MGATEDAVNAAAAANEASIAKTPSQIRQEKIDELYDKLIEARSNYTKSPEELSKAEKEYYTLKDGEDSYNTTQRNKYTIEATELKQDMSSKQEEYITKAFESIAYYESQRTYSKNVNSVKLTILDKILARLKQIQEETISKDTNNRKTFYMAQQQEWLTMCIQLINFSLISFTIVFIIYSVREHNITAFSYALVVFLIFVIFYLESIVKWIRTIPMSINVYTSWGEDADQSTFLFWGVFMVILFVFGVIYANNNEMNNYFNGV